jgi:hypothetical protein
MKKILLIISITLSTLLHCYSQTNQPANEKTAADNIMNLLGVNPGSKIVLVNSANRTKMADCFKSASERDQFTLIHFTPDTSQDSLKLLLSLTREKSDHIFFVFLIDPSNAEFLFQVAGRPDLGLKIPEERLFCNWLISEEQLIRLTSADLEENSKYQKKLRASLNTSDTILITTKAGTHLRFTSRNWVMDKGEIFCTPLEDETNGVIVVDGCAYWGPPVKSIRLKIENGRVANIDSLSETDKQEKWIKNDLTADENSSILAEVGIGTNKNALWNSDLMESEQAMGTCHFGFGMNIHYGGKIKSIKHVDLVILNPTIMVNKKLMCEDGILLE